MFRGQYGAEKSRVDSKLMVQDLNFNCSDFHMTLSYPTTSLSLGLYLRKIRGVDPGVPFPTIKRQAQHRFCSRTSSLILPPSRQRFSPGYQVLPDPFCYPLVAHHPHTEAHPSRNVHLLQTAILAVQLVSDECYQVGTSLWGTPFSLGKLVGAPSIFHLAETHSLPLLLPSWTTSTELLCPLASGKSYQEIRGRKKEEGRISPWLSGVHWRWQKP